MVRKLMKHELQYYVRSLVPVYIVLLVIALMGRFVLFFEQDEPAYYILMGSSAFMFGLACVASVLLCVIFSVVRFYKNMFSGEGYLTMTLPVKTSQHLFVKLSGALIAEFATVICISLAFCLLTVGPWLVEIMKAAVYTVKQTAEGLGNHFIWYALQYVVLMFVSSVGSILMLYACMSVGQLAKKNRILAAVGVYFGIYVIRQVASTLLMTAFTVLASVVAGNMTDETVQKISEWLSQYTEAQLTEMVFNSTHVSLCVAIAWALLVAVFYFTVSRFILSRKLNLE